MPLCKCEGEKPREKGLAVRGMRDSDPVAGGEATVAAGSDPRPVKPCPSIETGGRASPSVGPPGPGR